MRSIRPGFQRSQLLLPRAPVANHQRLKAWPRGLRPLRCSFAGLRMTVTSWGGPRPVQKMLNRRINSWRASIACAGFIRLSTFSRRSRSIAASSRTSWLRAFHFAYLPGANAKREQRGHDPNRNVCRGDEKHTKRKSRLRTLTR